MIHKTLNKKSFPHSHLERINCRPSQASSTLVWKILEQNAEAKSLERGGGGTCLREALRSEDNDCLATSRGGLSLRASKEWKKRHFWKRLVQALVSFCGNRHDVYCPCQICHEECLMLQKCKCLLTAEAVKNSRYRRQVAQII
jgi:hypothetical protein